jgi:pimeloyl-ACP methyl ester carboxylesterase
MPRPLVILHGWSDSSASFRKIATSLSKALDVQPKVIRLADYVSLEDEVRFDDLSAAMQRAWVDHGLPLDPGSVDAVIHSTGGLVIRQWMSDHFAPDAVPIKRLVMLAPANFGSPLAHKGRSFIGRVVKGYKGAKPFETGTHILNGLELASPYSWELAGRDRFSVSNPFNNGVLCTVIVGNSGYTGLASLTNEDGSDGTVRVSTANLEASRITADFATKPTKPSFRLENSRGNTAFLIAENENHSSITGKEKFRNPATFQDILTALQVDDAGFEAWRLQCDQRTAAATTKSGGDAFKNGYQNLVVRVRDDAGADVEDFFLEFFQDDADDPKDKVATWVHKEVIRKVHSYTHSGAFRSILINCTRLHDRLGDPKFYLNVSLFAQPQLQKNGYVGYLTFKDSEIGAIRLDSNRLRQLFTPHRTLLLDITLRRERADRVFSIKHHS